MDTLKLILLIFQMISCVVLTVVIILQNGAEDGLGAIAGVTGDVTKDTGVLTIKNLPASVLTGSDVNKALTVTCNIQMDLSLLGEINTSARMCIWNK